MSDRMSKYMPKRVSDEVCFDEVCAHTVLVGKHALTYVCTLNPKLVQITNRMSRIVKLDMPYILPDGVSETMSQECFAVGITRRKQFKVCPVLV